MSLPIGENPVICVKNQSGELNCCEVCDTTQSRNLATCCDKVSCQNKTRANALNNLTKTEDDKILKGDASNEIILASEDNIKLDPDTSLRLGPKRDQVGMSNHQDLVKHSNPSLTLSVKDEESSDKAVGKESLLVENCECKRRSKRENMQWKHYL